MNSAQLLSVLGQLLLMAVLVAINGTFVAAEIALVKIRSTQLDALVKRGSRGAAAARTLKSRLNTAIGTTQVGITLAGLLLGWYVEPLVHTAVHPLLETLGLGKVHWLDQLAFGLAFVAMSFVLIVAGEMVPKALALHRTESVAVRLARPLLLFQWLAHPMVWLIDESSRWILSGIGVDSLAEEVGQSVEEIRLALASQKQERGSELSRAIVLNSLDLRRRIVAEVMRPRREITPLSTDDTYAACLEIIEKTRYSRFPLCEAGNLDRTLGVVHIKDFYPLRGRAHLGADLIPVARPLIFVPETARLEKLLGLFLDRKLHFAIVVDEYGGTTGMVTLENVLEELVGQIQDEFDHEKPRLIQKGPAEWEIEGTLPLFELAELVGEPLEAPGVTTVGGWVTAQLGGFPRLGDSLKIGSYTLGIDDLEGLRVARLSLRHHPAVDPGTDAGINSVPDGLAD